MKKTIWLLSIVVILLSIGLAYSIRVNLMKKDAVLQEIVYMKSDPVALNRMNTLYERFLEHKTDYLMLIGSSIDSGPIITNINSNGKEIVWINDASQDAYTNGAVEFYNCKTLTRAEKDEGVVYSASNCEGYAEDDVKGMLTFPK